MFPINLAAGYSSPGMEVIIFNQRILFVHNPKTAGTSVLAHLQAVLAGPVYMAGANELGTHHPALSTALGYACGVTGKTRFDIVLTVIRNPFDREVSMYRYFREVLAGSPGLERDMPDAAMRRRVRKSAELEFNAYLQWLWEEEGTVDIWRSRCFYELAEGTRLESLRVLRFETVANDLAEALGTDGPSLPYLNVSSKHSPACHFDARSIGVVQASYDWVFRAGWYSPMDANQPTAC
jgi:hypothetical protein